MLTRNYKPPLPSNNISSKMLIYRSITHRLDVLPTPRYEMNFLAFLRSAPNHETIEKMFSRSQGQVSINKFWARLVRLAWLMGLITSDRMGGTKNQIKDLFTCAFLWWSNSIQVDAVFLREVCEKIYLGPFFADSLFWYVFLTYTIW